jgi:hypothetical protein
MLDSIVPSRDQTVSFGHRRVDRMADPRNPPDGGGAGGAILEIDRVEFERGIDVWLAAGEGVDGGVRPTCQRLDHRRTKDAAGADDEDVVHQAASSRATAA